MTSPEVSTPVGRVAEVPRALAFSRDGRTLAASAICSSEILCFDPANYRADDRAFPGRHSRAGRSPFS